MKIPTDFRLSMRCMSSSGERPDTALFPPRQRRNFHEVILDEILEERVVASRNRLNPRGVKRKMSNYPLRPRKRQRTRRVDFAARIRISKRTVLWG
jgi:hypothetical protein